MLRIIMAIIVNIKVYWALLIKPDIVSLLLLAVISSLFHERRKFIATDMKEKTENISTRELKVGGPASRRIEA